MQRVSLPVDSQGFVRRECPHCRRQFKARGGPEDGATVQRCLSQHLLFENDHEVSVDDAMFFCVYCGQEAPSDEWCTPQQRAWMEKVADVLAKEIQYELMQYPMRTLSQNPAPTFVAVPPPDDLPEMRAEEDDMRRTSFFCCVEDVKVEHHWVQPVYCPRCGAEHQTGPTRRFELSMAAVEA